MVRAAQKGDFREARRMAEKYHSLLTDLVFLEGNPVTIKAAMFAAGQIPSDEMRLPLVPISEANREKVVACLQTIQLYTEGER